MEALSDSSWASSGGDSDDINIMGDGFSDAKDYEVLQHIGGGTFGEVRHHMLRQCCGMLTAARGAELSMPPGRRLDILCLR